MTLPHFADLAVILLGIAVFAVLAVGVADMVRQIVRTDRE